jgi:hypothetical protein
VLRVAQQHLRARDWHHSDFEPAGFCRTLAVMGKLKIPATGEGYRGEILVHRITRAIGVVETVTEGKAGWPPQVAVKLKDGSIKKGKLSDFRDPSATEREKFSAA